MSVGKRRAQFGEFDWEKIPVKKLCIIAIIILLVVAFILYTVHTYNKRKALYEDTAQQNVIEEQPAQDSMPFQYEGYNVLGELVIDKINFRKYIVDSTEDSAMAKAPAKLYGDVINTIGNFCIAGHNYEEVFAKLNELAVGDTFYIVDREETIQDYVVKEILEVEPTDLSILMPVNDKIQVTLITCIDGATKRLVVRAERVEIEG